MKQWNTWKTKD